MHRLERFSIALLIFVAAACGGGSNGPPPTAAPTSTGTLPSSTATATLPSSTATGTLPPTATHTGTAGATATFTATLVPSATATPSATVPPAVGAIALFSTDPLAAANPFPTDRLLDQTGHVHVTGALLGAGVPDDPSFDTLRTYLETTAQTANQLEGFSTFAPMVVRFDAPIAVGPVPDGAAMVLSAEPPFALHPVTVVGVSAGSAGAEVIEIKPTIPLEARARYVYVVTTGAHDADGNRVRQDPDLAAALRGDVSTLADWRASLMPALDHLRNDLGVTTDEIAAIDIFTTQPTTDDLVSIVGQITSGTLPPAEPVFENSPIPDLITGIFPEGSPEFTQYVGASTSTAIAAVAVGSFPSYDFRYGPQRGFDPAKVAGEVTPSTNDLDFYMTIPKDPPPPGGYPITVFGHGLGQDGQVTIGVASTVGPDAGMLIGISALEHGRRGNVANFFNLNDAFATREHFRQTVADTIQLVNMIRHTSVPPFDQVNKDRVRYFGISLGGIMGSIFMGHEPNVKVGMLSVPGGGLPEIIQSDFIGRLLVPQIAQVTGVAQDDPFFPILFHNFLNSAQWLTDAGDPINVAPFVVDPARRLPGVPPKLILMHEGIHDSIVPNFTTDNLALAMGLPDVKASGGCTNAEGCSGIWRYVMSEYGQTEGHLVTVSVPQAAAQAKAYLVSDGTEIIDAAPQQSQATPWP